MGYIYKIYNNINNKLYIGQTILTVEHRFNEHKKAARNNIKCSLYNAMRKYGFKHFFVEEIEQRSEDDLNDRELYWISYYDSYKNGYNDTIGGDGRKKYHYKEIAEKYSELQSAKLTKDYFGCSYLVVHNACQEYGIEMLSAGESSWLHASEEYKNDKREKMRQLGLSLKGTKMSEKNKEILRQARIKKGLAHRVRCIETGEEFNSAEEARKAYNLKNSRCIRLSCQNNGEKYTSAGYHWEYIDKDNLYISDLKNSHLSEEHKKKLSENSGMAKKVICLDTNEVFNSALAAARAKELKSSSGISRCCLGKGETAGGYHWKFYVEEEG